MKIKMSAIRFLMAGAFLVPAFFASAQVGTVGGVRTKSIAGKVMVATSNMSDLLIDTGCSEVRLNSINEPREASSTSKAVFMKKGKGKKATKK